MQVVAAAPAAAAVPAESSQASDLSIWDDLPSGVCTPVEYRQSTTTTTTCSAASADKTPPQDTSISVSEGSSEEHAQMCSALPEQVVADQVTATATTTQQHLQDDNAGDFQLFDIGNPWTQADPSTQVQRKQWLRGCKTTDGLPSSDRIEVDYDEQDEEDRAWEATPHRKRRRVSVQQDDARSPPAQDADDTSGLPRAASTTKRPAGDIEHTSNPPVPRTRPRPKARASAGPTETEETNPDSTQVITHHRHDRRPTTADSSFCATLDAEDQEALQNLLAANNDDELAYGDANREPEPELEPIPLPPSSSTSSDDFEILTTPPPELRRRGLARMLSDLKPEQKHGYWNQFDDYVPPSERASRTVEQPLTPCPRPNPHSCHGSTTKSDGRRDTDSRLLPNPFRGFGDGRPVVDGDETASSSQPPPHPDYTPYRVPPHTGTSTPALGPAPIQRLDAQSPGTLIARSRNATGMGLATKTWESTWKARGVRIVKGRAVKSVSAAQDDQLAQSPARRAAAVRGRRGRGRGRR